MSRRARAAYGPADACQPEVIRAIQLLGLQFKVLSAAGAGIEDLLVLIPSYSQPPMCAVTRPAYWLFVECKVPSRKDGGVKPSKFTKAQREWREKTPNGPRITATGFENALDQLRALMGSTHSTIASHSASV